MVDQILIAQEDMGQRVSNVVAMGQGEPFLNYDNTLAASVSYTHLDVYKRQLLLRPRSCSRPGYFSNA